MAWEEISDEDYNAMLYLLEDTELEVHELLNHSTVFVHRVSEMWETAKYHLIVYVTNPSIYKKNQNKLTQMVGRISSKYTEVSRNRIVKEQVRFDKSSIQILHNRYVPIQTPWEDINGMQSELLYDLKTAKSRFDFNNIGNSCRNLLQEVAKEVFNPEIHKAPIGKQVADGNYKNGLHTYIKYELGGGENEKLRAYALASVETAEKGIDLANSLTHGTNSDKMEAELCVQGTLNVISLVKLIEGNKSST